MIGLDDALWRSEEWLGEHDDRGLDRSMALLEREKLGFGRFGHFWPTSTAYTQGPLCVNRPKSRSQMWF